MGKVDGDPLMEQLEDHNKLEFLVKERALFDLESNVGAPQTQLALSAADGRGNKRNG